MNEEWSLDRAKAQSMFQLCDFYFNEINLSYLRYWLH